MKFEELGIKNSLLWFFIAIFLFFWLGGQLFGAVTNLEIENLRVTDMVSFHSRPIWFTFIACFKSMAWAFSILVIYKYAKSKLIKQNT
jgi:hypothetical protein